MRALSVSAVPTERPSKKVTPPMRMDRSENMKERKIGVKPSSAARRGTKRRWCVPTGDSANPAVKTASQDGSRKSAHI